MKDLLQAGFRYAFSLTQSQHDAEDLVHDAWIRLNSKQRKQCNKSLMFTTIRNLFIDQYRRKILIVFDALDDDNEPATIDDSIIGSIEMAEIEHALQSIRVEEREAIYLNVVEGYTAQEIAELTQRSRNTVLGLLSRGKQKVINHLHNKAAKPLNQSADNARSSPVRKPELLK